MPSLVHLNNKERPTVTVGRCVFIVFDYFL